MNEPKFNIAAEVKNADGRKGIVLASIAKEDGYVYTVHHQENEPIETLAYREDELSPVDPYYNLDTGILSAEVEHIWSPKENLPSSLHRAFPQGVCVVFANEELTAAIPATEEQTEKLIDLMEQAAISWPVGPDDLRPYKKLRDQLCAPSHYVPLTAFFKVEMEKQQAREEGNRSKYTTLASAARNN
jgi:hypothetical protein